MLKDQLQHTIETASVMALIATHPTLYATIKKMVEAGQTPQSIDAFIAQKFGLPKGNVIRDSCYYASQHIRAELEVELLDKAAAQEGGE